MGKLNIKAGGNVNIAGGNIKKFSNNKSEGVIKNKKRWYYNPWIVGIGTIVIATVLINFIGWGGNDEIIQDNVVSINQSGGITANEVNVGNSDRHLDEKSVVQLEESLPEDKSQFIEISCMFGDIESYQLATEIKAYLETEGWGVGEIVEKKYFTHRMGVLLTPTINSGFEIIVGSKY